MKSVALIAGCVGAAILGAACGQGTSATGHDAGVTHADASLDATRHPPEASSLATPESSTQGTLQIAPQNKTLTVSAPGVTQQFHATEAGSTTSVSATWTLSNPLFGTIDGTGLFTASALVGGQVTIEATSSAEHAQTVLTVNLALTDNSGGVSTAVQQQLEAGGSADSGLAWLYPYDGTVFPRGLLAPTLQFGGVAPDAVYVHVSFGTFDYKGFYGPSNPGQVALAASVWTAITETAIATDSVTVELTKISGGNVSGPISEAWTIAQGSLKGTVYYESRYSTPTDTGATMRIKPGATQPDVLLGNCTVCHYVSSDGSTLVAELDGTGTRTSAAYDLTNSAAIISQLPNETFALAALYKDGSLAMSGGLGGTAPAGDVIDGVVPSQLIDVKTGVAVSAPGWDGVVTKAVLPSFSPDGTELVFNHYDTGTGHSLAVMSFDVATSTFSSLVDIATDPTNFLSWPSFTPDAEWVLYDANSASSLISCTAACCGDVGQGTPKSDLQIAHVASKTTASLDVLNGVKNGQYYLPFGETAEGHMNYQATVLPVAVGGYYWVVFTSRREYGDTINTSDPYYCTSNQTPGALPWRKKLWVAALDIDDPAHPSTSAHDISHPAFYLPGQDLETGNYRGFWALSPCQQNGTGCASGDECCSGFCRSPVAGPPSGSDAGGGSVCVQPQACANEFEKCSSSSDCCQANEGFSCINGFCAQPAPH